MIRIINNLVLINTIVFKIENIFLAENDSIYKTPIHFKVVPYPSEYKIFDGNKVKKTLLMEKYKIIIL